MRKASPMLSFWLALTFFAVLQWLAHTQNDIPRMDLISDLAGFVALAFSGLLLSRQITAQHRTEQELGHVHEALDQRVRERTVALTQANTELRTQIVERERAESQLRSLISTTQDAVITIDREGRILLFNPAAERIFGYTRGDVQGQFVQTLMPDPYASEHNDYIARYEQSGKARAIGRIRTVAARRKNGEVFPIELSVAEITTPDETTYGAFIRDISDKVRLQEQLVERERLAAIGTTAAIFAHEIGNPLNSMFMTGQLLERYIAKNHDQIDQKAGETLQNLMSEIKRLSALLSEFRSLARRQKLDLHSVSLTTLIADVLAAETPSYQASGVRVEQDVPVDLPVVVVDAEKVRQAVLNLCKNAVEAMPQGGILCVSAKHQEGTIRIAISDTGAGIPPGVNIFEPFITTKSQGTGLGLTIVRQIVAAHHGTLTYHSAPGQGTTFTLELPVTPPPGYDSRDTARRAPTLTKETTEHRTNRE